MLIAGKEGQVTAYYYLLFRPFGLVIVVVLVYTWMVWHLLYDALTDGGVFAHWVSSCA